MAYQKHMEVMHARYTASTWVLLYQADVRFRSEHILRVRRELAAAHEKARAAGNTTPYDPARPWNYAMEVGIKDMSWWNNEMRDPAMLLLAKADQIGNFVGGDAPISASHGMASHVTFPHSDWSHNDYGAGNNNHGKKRKPTKNDPGNGRSQGSHGQGQSVCAAFQTGACTVNGKGNSCSVDPSKIHHCEWCGKPGHGSRYNNPSQCGKHHSNPKGKDSGKKGKDKGKGKSKKGKHY